MASPTDDGDQSVERKIIMAVDFGTTYSGLAWAQTRKPEIQSPVIQWPDATSGGLEGATSDKVPTEIQYNDQGYKWGFQISDFGIRHQWFKLLLDPSQSRSTSGLAKKYPDINASPPVYGRGPEELVKDYLTALRCHAERVLRHKLPQSALASTPIEFVITVPAVWSDRAQASTRRCAEQAGMGTGSSLHMISGPEAAAMYALDAMDPHNIEVGDTFVLCDAGGGTVDLISYKLSELKPVLRIEEAAPGNGSLCGSTFSNRIFHRFLLDRFGADSNWDEDVLEEAMKRFEVTVKRSFYGNPNDEYQIPGKDFRSSRWTAVVRGALIKGLASTNTSFPAVRICGRSARKSYGTEVEKEFDKLLHDYTWRYWSGFHGRYTIEVMSWFIQKGETVEEDKPKRLCYFQKHRTDGPPPAEVKLAINMCADNDNTGPSVYNDSNRGCIIHRVCELVEVSADLSRIPRRKLPKVLGADGHWYYKIGFAVEITYCSAYTKYELIHDNVNYGPVTAEYV
ncbi:MAG: hypothetical protein Q9221_006958 [Calogaya cf. arnoldii]